MINGKKLEGTPHSFHLSAAVAAGSGLSELNA
ncbi:hypothetical protein J2W37_002407 [Variovorax paradoxus]|uniref:Uncharacterized protein n=1 Tax=Variovorax paradoxus TaxID=34073 RepID=A0AAE3Y1R7_VARPD|nr:hypothetical protein [Variovorax paradoxus]MDR6427586.1 hypothetical protein [Variovorax paradoxus]MDR6454748.1 hypothetical protein [Variovorax paradoxus]